MRWVPTLAVAAIAETLAWFLGLTWGFAALILAFVIVSLRVSTNSKAYSTEARVAAIQPVLAAHGAAITTAQNAANTANTNAGNAQNAANTANATANNAQGAVNNLTGGTTGAANNGGETSGPQNYGQTGGAVGNIGTWNTGLPSHNGTWETGQPDTNTGQWSTGGQVGGASPHTHLQSNLAGANHTHPLPNLPGADHYHVLPSLPGDGHTHSADDGHTHAMAHGHPIT